MQPPGHPLQVNGATVALDEPALQQRLNRATLQGGETRHHALEILGMHELEQRPASDFTGRQAEQAFKGLVDFPEVPVKSGNGEQLDLGEPGGCQARVTGDGRRHGTSGPCSWRTD